MMKIEITVPVLNEEKTLAINVEKILDFLRNSTIENYSIVIADNGSTDNTEKIGKEIHNTHSNVKYIRVPRKGVGLALKTSWLQSEADIVTYMDLDLATDLKHLVEAYNKIRIDNYDVVNGSRLSKKSVVRNRKIKREITSRIFNLFVRICFKVPLKDFTCGFKVLRRKVVNDIIRSYEFNEGWFFIIEILIISSLKKFRLTEIPVTWSDDPNSSISIPKLSIHYLKESIKLSRNIKNNKIRL